MDVIRSGLRSVTGMRRGVPAVGVHQIWKIVGVSRRRRCSGGIDVAQLRIAKRRQVLFQGSSGTDVVLEVHKGPSTINRGSHSYRGVGGSGYIK